MMGRKIAAVLLSALFAFSVGFYFTACGESVTPPDQNGGTTVPSTDVDPYCIGVDIKSYPVRRTYNEGEVFSPVGLVFDATFIIDGEEEFITNMTYTDCTYTHKGESLTSEITEIVFDCFSYSFSMSIDVKHIEYTGIEVGLGALTSDVYAGDEIDLTELVVNAYTASGAIKLSADSYILKDNGERISSSRYYEMKEGEHEFEVSFLDYTDSVTVRAWDASVMTRKGITVDPSQIGGVLVSGECVNLTKARVFALYESPDGRTAGLGEPLVITSYALKGGGVISDPAGYLLEGTQTITVTADGQTADFTLETTNYDIIETVRRDGTTSDKVTKNSDFAATYFVRLRVEGTSKVREINPLDYTVTSTRGDVTEEDNVRNLFDVEGEVTVGVAYGGLETSVTVDVLEGSTVYTKDNYASGTVSGDIRNYVELPEGTEVNVNGSNPEDNGFKYIGDVNESDVLIFHIWAERSGTAEIIINGSSTVKTDVSLGDWYPTQTDSVRFNTVFEAYRGTIFNQLTKTEISDNEMLEGYSSTKLAYSDSDPYKYLGFDDEGRAYDHMIWTNWHPVSLGTIKLTKGDNIITLRYCGGDGDGKCNVYSLEARFKEV